VARPSERGNPVCSSDGQLLVLPLIVTGVAATVDAGRRLSDQCFAQLAVQQVLKRAPVGFGIDSGKERAASMMKDKSRTRLAAVFMVLACSICGAAPQAWDALAKTPPMGWNSWNTFRLKINEEVVRGVADMFVEKGFKDAGYEYILLNKWFPGPMGDG
jgi:hypothetical protein